MLLLLDVHKANCTTVKCQAGELKQNTCGTRFIIPISDKQKLHKLHPKKAAASLK